MTNCQHFLYLTAVVIQLAIILTLLAVDFARRDQTAEARQLARQWQAIYTGETVVSETWRVASGQWQAAAEQWRANTYTCLDTVRSYRAIFDPITPRPQPLQPLGVIEVKP